MVDWPWASASCPPDHSLILPPQKMGEGNELEKLIDRGEDREITYQLPSQEKSCLTWDAWLPASPMGCGSAVGVPDSRVPISPGSPHVAGVAQVSPDVWVYPWVLVSGMGQPWLLLTEAIPATPLLPTPGHLHPMQFQMSIKIPKSNACWSAVLLQPFSCVDWGQEQPGFKQCWLVHTENCTIILACGRLTCTVLQRMPMQYKNWN